MISLYIRFIFKQSMFASTRYVKMKTSMEQGREVVFTWAAEHDVHAPRCLHCYSLSASWGSVSCHHFPLIWGQFQVGAESSLFLDSTKETMSRTFDPTFESHDSKVGMTNVRVTRPMNRSYLFWVVMCRLPAGFVLQSRHKQVSVRDTCPCSHHMIRRQLTTTRGRTISSPRPLLQELGSGLWCMEWPRALPHWPESIVL